MTDDEMIARWEGEGGLPDLSDREQRQEYARRTVQENQYDIRSQKVTR